MPRANEEAKGQGLCVKWFRDEYNNAHYGIFSVLNERKDIKPWHINQGLTPGVSDMIITYPNMETRGILFVELKIKPNKLSPNQEAFLERQDELGHTAVSITANDRFGLLDTFKKVVKKHMEGYKTFYEELNERTR